MAMDRESTVMIRPSTCRPRQLAVVLLTALTGVVLPDPATAQYTELADSFTTATLSTWTVRDLTPFGVPANTVVEIVISNGDFSNQRWGGVRAVGSSLDRRLQLQESESSALGEHDLVTMHVQADANSRIEYYGETASITFMLAGYWASGSYVERFDVFTAGSSASWVDRDLCGYGVGPKYVAEIAAVNKNTSNEREAGARTNGSVLQRRFDLHEAESGGVDAVSMFVQADATLNATIEVYAEVNADVDFYLLGYWSRPPGAYTETFVAVASPVFDATWQDRDLTASGVPDNAVAEFVLSHLTAAEGDDMGIRANGSANARIRPIHRAEAGGGDHYRMHVLSDNTATVEFYHEDVSDAHTFRLVGFWTTCDPSIEYVVTDLGAITPANASLGLHINSTRHIAGFEEDVNGDATAWILSCGTHTGLGTLGGAFAEAHGINDADVVVGWALDGGGDRRAFRWTSGGGMVDLGTVSGRSDSEALSVNGNGEIVGTVVDFGSPPVNRLAFLYLPLAAYGLGAGMHSLDTLGGHESLGMDLNDAGQVVGGAQNAAGQFRPFRWENGVMTDLGTLGGESRLVDHRAEAINSSGHVVGRSYTAAGTAHAFFWDGVMNDLGVLGGGTQSWAFGINDSDVVVGTADVGAGVFRAFVWDGVNGMRNLNSLIPLGSGWTLIRAMDIAADGSIVGWGTNPSADTRAFLLTPTCGAAGGAAAMSPEPGSMDDDPPLPSPNPIDAGDEPLPPTVQAPVCAVNTAQPFLATTAVLFAQRLSRRRKRPD